MNISPMQNGNFRIIQEPFSENDVLYLQDLFLTPGVHQITVDSFSKVRIMINKILRSLHYHQKAACLTFVDLLLEPEICDITQVLIADDYLVSKDRLMLFFLDQFYFDFLWIEETPDLLTSIWYEQFQRHLSEFNFNRSIPIIKVSLKLD